MAKEYTMAAYMAGARKECVEGQQQDNSSMVEDRRYKADLQG